ncbi:PucR family transcriptional regulator [Saccharopolyspora hordei]|uniref:PucR family transcriptional regulator n=1 Tax=Saccharopolyspora hordei TaxID=1838 RepID=UPI0035E96494
MDPTTPDVLALPTVSEVLDLPVLRRGKPRVVAGASGLDGRVRWVHVAEIADIAPLLSGGELVLTTGIALPEEPAELARYVDGLAAAGACGLVVELVRRWRDRVPDALVDAAHRHDLPLVTLSEETKFVSVTEAVVARIRDAQLAELRATHAIHETFTALTTSGAEPASVLREASRLLERPVVLETMAHQVLAYDAAGQDPVALLSDWSERSRAVVQSGRTCYDPERGWLTTVVGARGDDWGRLVVLGPEPAHRHVVVAERAASALAVNRLVTRDRESLERQTHRTLITELLSGGADTADLAARAAGVGVPLDGPLVGIAVRPHTTTTPAPALETQQALRDLVEATALAARRARLPVLVGVVDDVTVHAVVVLSDVDAAAAQHRLAADVRRSAALPLVIAVGTEVASIAGARRTLTEAAQVAEAALHVDDGTRAFHRLDDVRLRGLLHLLRGDERLTAFAERELGPILDDQRLLDALRALCRHGGNKSAAAASAHLSRTAYYGQLARIEQLLGVPLDNPESLVSLHVALLTRDMHQE